MVDIICGCLPYFQHISIFPVTILWLAPSVIFKKIALKSQSIPVPVIPSGTKPAGLLIPMLFPYSIDQRLSFSRSSSGILNWEIFSHALFKTPATKFVFKISSRPTID